MRIAIFFIYSSAKCRLYSPKTITIHDLVALFKILKEVAEMQLNEIIIIAGCRYCYLTPAICDFIYNDYYGWKIKRIELLIGATCFFHYRHIYTHI